MVGVIGGALPFYLFFEGLSRIPAINAALIHKTLVLWVAVMAGMFLGERLTKVQVLGVMVLFASNLLIGGFEGFVWSKGEGMVLAATVLWAVENVIAKKVLEDVDADVVAAARMGIGSLILLGMMGMRYGSFWSQLAGLDFYDVWWLLMTAWFLLAYVMSWYRALQEAPAVTVATVLVSSTLVTNLLSAILVTHVWDTRMLIRGAMVGLGLVLFLAQSRRVGANKGVVWDGGK